MHLKWGTTTVELRNVWPVTRRILLWVERVGMVALFGVMVAWVLSWLL
jgi:hypothetical protein